MAGMACFKQFIYDNGQFGRLRIDIAFIWRIATNTHIVLALFRSGYHLTTLARRLYAPVKGSMRTTARAPTALAKR
jgi:hypothetical protein